MAGSSGKVEGASGEGGSAKGQLPFGLFLIGDAEERSRAGLSMKFTFASLMLLLAHALMGVPLDAQTLRAAASAEAGTGDVVADSSAGIGLTGLSAERIGVSAVPATLAQSADVVRGIGYPSRGTAYAALLPLRWGAGDRHAHFTGKP